MNTNTKQTENLSECGNKSKPLLCEVTMPTMEQFGWYSASHFEEESGWMYEGGEEAYYKALKKYNFMIENGLGEDDMKNDISLPHEF